MGRIERRQAVTSPCHGSKISGCQQTNMKILKKEKQEKKKIDTYDFPVHDCTQEPNGSLYFSSIVHQCK